MRRRTFPPCICLFILTLLSPRTLPADTLLDDFQVNTEFPGHPPQDSPLSVANWGTQTIYTTWLSQRDGTNWDAALIRHNYDLEPIGEATYLNIREGTYNCVKPRLVVSSAGVGAAWIEARSPNRIMFRSLDASGNPLSAPVRVEDDFQNIPRDSLNIAALTDGYLLVWYDLRDSSKIWAQKVDFSGNLIGANFPIQPDSTGSILGLEAQNHPDGRVLVSWVTNGQYSRGRWLNSLGNFMGGVFDMAEGWVDELIGRSIARFATDNLGILYQYSNTQIGEVWDWAKYMYTTQIGSDGTQLSPRAQAGAWAGHWDEGSSHSDFECTFPDLILMPSCQYMSIYRHHSSGYAMGGFSWNNICDYLYSSLLDTSIVPWGLVTAYDLCLLGDSACLFVFDLAYIGMRKYAISNLDSSEQIIWIGEPGFAAPQGRSGLCTHQNGDFRIIYNNLLGCLPVVNTRYFDAQGTPSGQDSQISLSEDLTPVLAEGGRIKKLENDQALIIWPYDYDVLGTLFTQATWSGAINEFGISPGIPIVPSGIPNLDANSSDRVMIMWRNIYEYYEWLNGQLYCQPFQFFNNYLPSLAVGPIFWTYGYPDYEFDISLRNDGRFLTCWSYGWLRIQAGTNYGTLIGDPLTIAYSGYGAPSLEKTSAGYWLAWVFGDSTYMQRIDADGNPVGGIQPISEDGALALGDPDLAVSDSSNNFAVVWQDARADAGDIYCRQFNPDGSFFGREYRVNSDLVGVLQKEPAVALGPNDQLYFTWTDFRNPGGQGDIYCKVIEWQDALYAPEEPVQVPHKFALYPPSPNPFNSTTVIRFELPQAGNVTLQIYDISGRNVGARHASPLHLSGSGATPTTGWLDAGVHEVRFDGSGLASGIYIVRLEGADFSAAQKLILLK